MPEPRGTAIEAPALNVTAALNGAIDILLPLLLANVESWLAPTVEWLLQGQRGMAAQEPFLTYEILCTHPDSYNVRIPYRYYQLLREVAEDIASRGGTVSHMHETLLPRVFDLQHQ